jgi:hypothetical protein
MKPWIVAVLAAIVGAAAGLGAARVYCMREIRAHFGTAVEALADKQEYTCVISLAALNRLEEGQADRAKLLLAREVASYYRHPLGQTQSQRQKLLTLIDSTSAKSEILKEELSKKAQ